MLDSVIRNSVASQNVSAQSVDTIVELNLPLLQAADNTVKAYEWEARGGNVNLISMLTVALNMSGRQRMLSQKVVKDYCQIGMGLNSAKSSAGLNDSLALFGQQLEKLQAFAKHAPLRTAVADVATTWHQFKEITSHPANNDNARRLNHLSDDLLYRSHKVVQFLQDRADTPGSRLINISGRQRMLSQRIAKLFLLRSWGVNTISIREEERLARRDFDDGLAELHHAPENTAEITLELDKVDLQWAWFKSVLEQHDLTSYQLVVVEASDAILASMENVTHAYEVLGN